MSRSALLTATVISNMALWGSYGALGLRQTDFGDVPPYLHTYLLITAAVAYVSNLAYVGVLLTRDESATSVEMLTVTTICVACYYAMQLFFLPLVRASQSAGGTKVWTRALLLLCVIPVAVLAGMAVRQNDVTLMALGFITLLHVLVNDALIYGFLF